MTSLTLLADENVHRAIVSRLTEDGHTVLHVADLDPGIVDTAVAALAEARHAVLVTNDLDFGELVFRHGLPHAGVLLLRLGSMAYVEQAAHVARIVAQHGASLPGAFAVLSPTKLRLRSR